MNVLRLLGEADRRDVLGHVGGGRELDQRQVEVCPVVVIVGVHEDLLHAEPLLPALLHRVVMLAQHDLPVCLRLAAVEAVRGREVELEKKVREDFTIVGIFSVIVKSSRTIV